MVLVGKLRLYAPFNLEICTVVLRRNESFTAAVIFVLKTTDVEREILRE